MTNKYIGLGCLILGVMGVVCLFPEMSFAQGFGGGSGFESKISGLTNQLITIVMPAIATLGLVYAAFLASTGDPSAKPRMVAVIVASVIAFLAPVIIRWLQAAAGSGGL